MREFFKRITGTQHPYNAIVELGIHEQVGRELSKRGYLPYGTDVPALLASIRVSDAITGLGMAGEGHPDGGISLDK
jgi:hypothetical protein